MGSVLVQGLLCWVIAISLLLSWTSAQAETRYVSDILVISLRDAPTKSATVIGHLRSGNPMEVVEDNGNGYLYIKTSDGQEGWVQTRYTTTNLPKARLIKQLKSRIAGLEKKLEKQQEMEEQIDLLEKTRKEEAAQYKQQIETLTAQLSTTRESAAEVEKQYQELLEKSKSVVETYQINDELQAENSDMKKKVTFLEAENKDLVQTGRILWFLAGFGVFFMGWLMGRMGRKQRHSSLTL